MSELRKRIKSEFDYDLAALTAAPLQDRDVAIRAITENRTVEAIETNTDVKMDDKWKAVDVDVVWQDSGCNKESEGEVVFTDKPMTAKKIAVHLELCNDDLIKYWPQLSLPRGAYAELQELPFEQRMMELFVRRNNVNVSNAIWRSDTTLTGQPNLNRFNGLAKQIITSGSTIPAGTGAITASNALARFTAVADAIPSAVFAENNDVKVFCSHTDFKLLLANIRALNYFHYAPEAGRDLEMEIPGTGVMAYVDFGVPAGYLFAGRRSDFMMNTNIASEFNEFEMGYDFRSDLLIVKCNFYLGALIGFDNQIVKWTPAGS
jgi:hypothetical protein